MLGASARCSFAAICSKYWFANEYYSESTCHASALMRDRGSHEIWLLRGVYYETRKKAESEAQRDKPKGSLAKFAVRFRC